MFFYNWNFNKFELKISYAILLFMNNKITDKFFIKYSNMIL